MSSPSSSNHEGNDAWLMKIELKREEPMEINTDEEIKKAMEPVMKSRAIPGNLNDAAGAVEKQEVHYLHGIV